MKKLIAIALCAVMCLSLFSCVTGEAGEEGKSVTAGEYDGNPTIAFQNSRETLSPTTCAIDNGILYMNSYDGYNYFIYSQIFTSYDEWKEVAYKIGLTSYDRSFFEENALVVVEADNGWHSNTWECNGATYKTLELEAIAVVDGSICPILKITHRDPPIISTSAICEWFMTAEVAKADIEGYELGEVTVELNIISVETESETEE
ncbi:MAG: hypothetical protein LUE25_02830 [Clostridiales bacterium]|nr:hypothetical protein [Clostridiales bacterium]